MGAGLQIGGALSSRRARRRSAQPMSEINVTPMVDVMLVLLIIFMVTAPMLTVGLAAAIPAVVMYNRFSRQLRVLTAEMDTFGSEFLNIAERHFLK